MLNLHLRKPGNGHFYTPRTQSVCLWSQRHMSLCVCAYVCVYVCVLCYPPPLPCVCNRLITYVNCAQAKTLKSLSVSMKSLHWSAMLWYLHPPTPPLLLKTNRPSLHAYYTLLKGRCMQMDATVPDPQATMCDSHSFLGKMLKHSPRSDLRVQLESQS